jgi:oligoendopeptidase F
MTSPATLRLSEERNRANIPEPYTWKINDVYPGDAEWKKEKEKLQSALPGIAAFKGRLSESPGVLADCLESIATMSKEFSRLHVYAQMASDVDTRDAARLAMTQEMGQLGADLATATSFVDPEILLMGKPRIDDFLAREPRLAVHRHGLDDLLRRAEHTGTAGEEKILADAVLIADGPGSMYTIFSNADFPFAKVTLRSGMEVKLDKAAFAQHRQAPVREDRQKVFAAFFGKLGEFQRTYGTQLYAEIKKNMFFARARKYPSALAAALDRDNIPTGVYHRLIQGIHDHLPVFHRYLTLRKKLLGVDQLHYYDLYVPAVPEVDLSFSFEEGREMVLGSLAPLGESYLQVARRAFADRWFDVFPAEGKISGAYSNGAAYDVHPYMLLNYQEKYDDVSTLTHELGHTMHSFLSNTAQPYVLSHYAIFVAEVASTFNEALLLDDTLKTVKDKSTRLNLLMHTLDGFRATLFRQTQFAEFELRIHEMAERGESLTGEGLSWLYQEITRKYYGHDEGVCIVDDEIKYEWMYIPHFYYDFYVFQYATSLTASEALCERLLSGGKEETERYLALLKSGGSDYPIALLQKAGMDMTTAEPFTLMMKRMERVMAEVERYVK